VTSIYGDLAGWYHLITRQQDYAFEAGAYITALGGRGTLLELGCGGGNVAYHLKSAFQCTLTDLSPAMLEQSRRLNPECEHVAGDMCTLRLQRSFDAVFVHDAITYMRSEADLARAIETAFVHLRRGGVAVFAPISVLETFEPGLNAGGHDGADGRALRYLEWMHELQPDGCTFHFDHVYVLAEGGEVRVVHERHTGTVFAVATWERLLRGAGFHVETSTRFKNGEPEEFFVCIRP
jgi:SAM-dependent methyltransferase